MMWGDGSQRHTPIETDTLAKLLQAKGVITQAEYDKLVADSKPSEGGAC